MNENLGHGKKPVKYELLLLVINDSARPKEIHELGYTYPVAYRYSSKANKIKEDYYALRKRLRALRDKK
jgi:hypothetical protein